MIELSQREELAIVQEVPAGAFDAIYRDESGYAVAFHASDWSRITAASPAKEGEWILFFASNLGRLDRPLEDGALAPENNTPLASMDLSRDRLLVRLVDANLAGGTQYSDGGLVSCGASTVCQQPLAAGLLGVFFIQVYVNWIYGRPGTIQHGLVIERRVCSSDRFPCPDLRVMSSRTALLHVAEPE